MIILASFELISLKSSLIHISCSRAYSWNFLDPLSVSDASLTDKGSKKFQEYALEHEMWINELLSDISSNDAKMITSLLSSITEKGDLK